MRGVSQTICGKMFIFLLWMLVTSCTGLPYLNLTYRLPAGVDEMRGKRVGFALEDETPASRIMGRGALEEFGTSQSVVSFAVAHGSGPVENVGIYEIPVLLKEAFKRRLEHAGMSVVSPGDRVEIELTIVIRDFFLDFVDRKWQFRMAYEARLGKDGRFLASQTIRGQAERLKILGRKQADEIVGEVFTDTINQLDLRRLYNQAGL